MIKKLQDIEILSAIIENFEKRYDTLGGNVTYALETAFLKAAAKENKKELFKFIKDSISPHEKIKIPMPVGNCIGGGLHSKFIKNKRPDFQEFLLIPNEETFSKAVAKNIRAYEYAKKLLKSRKRNDENAWITDKTNEEVLEIVKEVAEKYGLRIGIDIAASSFYENGYYKYKNKELIRDRLEQIDYITRLIKEYSIFYVEDPLDQNDFLGFKQITNIVNEEKLGTLIVGDDLTTTNPRIVEKVARSRTINALIIKPNQIGSIMKVLKVVQIAKKAGIKTIFSHRSGETMDNALSDYAVGFGADFIKAGIYGRERLIKLKRIIDIERNSFA